MQPIRPIAGELYLFHTTDPLCPASCSLWGVFDEAVDRRIHLESSSSDLQEFRLWHPLPEEFVYMRLATRSELRDYVFNLACYQFRMEQLGKIQMPSSVLAGMA